MKNYILLCIVGLCVQLCALDCNLPSSAILSAANGMFLLCENPSSISQNPSLQIDGVEVGYCDIFNIKQISYSQIHFAKQLKANGIYLGVDSYNHELISENTYKLSLSRRFQNIKIGAGFRIFDCKIKNEKSLKSYVFDLGLGFDINTIKSYLAVKNITKEEIEESKLPIIFLWNISNEVSEHVKICFGIEKEKLYDVSFKIGSCYIYSFAKLLASYQFNPDRFGIGLDIKVKDIHFSTSLRTHQFLNNTIFYAVSYEI